MGVAYAAAHRGTNTGQNVDTKWKVSMIIRRMWLASSDAEFLEFWEVAKTELRSDVLGNQVEFVEKFQRAYIDCDALWHIGASHLPGVTPSNNPLETTNKTFKYEVMKRKRAG